MYKELQLHATSTYQKTELYKCITDAKGALWLEQNEWYFVIAVEGQIVQLRSSDGHQLSMGYEHFLRNCLASHIHLTSNDEIEEGDWYVWQNGDMSGTSQRIGGMSKAMHKWKIVATTDIRIWQHYSTIGQIPQNLIQDFVKKQGMIKSVMVEHFQYDVKGRPTDEEDIDNLSGYYPKLNESGEINWKPVEIDILELVADTFRQANVRQYVNMNDSGYSLLERQAAERLKGYIKGIARQAYRYASPKYETDPQLDVDFENWFTNFYK